jgi:hypothetical protein
MRNTLACFVAMAVLVTACADMSTPSTPSSSATTTTQSSPVPGRDNTNNNPNPAPTPAPGPAPNQPGRVELKGAIAGLNGQCPSINFTIAGSPVSTRAATAFEDGACATLKNGDQVEVEGARENNVLMADRVERKNDDADDDEDDDNGDDDNHRGGDDGNRQGGEVELNGAIAGLGGGCPSITFTVTDSTVTTSGSTRFDDGSCSSLKNGDRVEVKGVRQSPTMVAASRVQKKK